MEEGPPQPDDLGGDHTGAPHKRPRSHSESSTSIESIRSTRSLISEDFDFVYENGRVYGNKTYFMPCDQAEQDRLSILHQVFVHALKGKLTTTRITPMTRRILDLGTGPGYWAVAMAQQCPFAEVVGLDMAVWDLETTESIAGESRVTWEIDDLDVWGVESEVDDLSLMLEHYDPFHGPTHRPSFEPASKARQKHGEPQSPDPTASDDTAFDPYVLEPPAQPGWNFSEPFDLIHLRNMKGVFAAWEDVYAEIYKNLSPGGWVEIADFDIAMPDAGDTANPLFPTISKLCRSLMQASFKAGRPAGTFYMHPSYLEEAGFKDVHTTYVNVPVGQWPEDEEQKKIGKMMFVVVMESLEPQMLRLLTSCGDAERVWTAREVREHVERSKKEILEWSAVEPGLRSWCAHFKWIVGRKSKNA